MISSQKDIEEGMQNNRIMKRMHDDNVILRRVIREQGNLLKRIFGEECYGCKVSHYIFDEKIGKGKWECWTREAKDCSVLGPKEGRHACCPYLLLGVNEE